MVRRLAMMSLWCGLLTGVVAGASAPGRAEVPGAPSARELAAALSAERLGLAAGEATLAMELRDKAGRVLGRTLRARTATGEGWRKMRMTFLEPADQRGVELLVLEARGQAPVQYLWLPRSAELRRVAAGERGGRFQGSDFSFADFEERNLDEAVITLLDEEEVGGLAAYRLEIAPRDGAAAPGGWSRVVAWIAKEARVPLRVQFFGEDALARQLDVKRLQPLEGRMVPTRLVMSDIKRGTRTTLDISGLSPGAKFPEGVFTPEALGR